MRVIQNKLLPFGSRYYAVNLFGVIFAKGPCTKRVLNHEGIHTAQMREMVFLFFYIWYAAEWLFRLVQFGNAYKAYRHISFEKEAYANERNLSYLASRSHFRFLKYLA